LFLPVLGFSRKTMTWDMTPGAKGPSQPQTEELLFPLDFFFL
jgi:hypothetical protein